jgi:branched-chain amino acid transport system substrate-binding protein
VGCQPAGSFFLEPLQRYFVQWKPAAALKAVEALKSDADGKAVVAKMKELPTDDKLFGKGTVRADGRKIHPMYLVEVKTPAESKGPWDYFKVRATIPADEAFRPLSEGGCPLVNR